MSIKETAATTSKLQIVVVGKDGIARVIDINELSKIMANGGDKFQILRKVNGENVIVDNFIAIKDGEALELSFATGETLSIENFYSYNNVEVSFEVSSNSVHTLSSQSGFGQELADGTTLVYAQGNQDTLLSLAKGNDSLEMALSNQLSVQNSELFAAAETAGAGASAGTTGTVAGVSTAALVVGGVVVVGAVAAASNSDSKAVAGTTDSTSTGVFVDSPVAGVTYTRFIDANDNGILDGGETIVGTGVTSATGTFPYKAGETIVFSVAGITLGSMAAEDVPADGQVYPQDILGVERADVADASVTAMARLLQTLDSDGDPSNGITVETNENGDIVTDSGEVMITSANVTANTGDIANIAALLATVDTTVTYESGANVAVVSVAAAQAHILGTVTGVADITTITASDVSELADLILGGATSVIVDTTMDLTDLAALVTATTITQEQADAISGYTGSITVNDLNDSNVVNLSVTLSQYNAMSINAAGDDTITVNITAADAEELYGDPAHIVHSLTLTNADVIFIGAGVSAELTVAQGLIVDVASAGDFYVKDSLANLTGDAGDLSGATMVMLELTADTDLTGITLDDDVNFIDAENNAVTLTDTQYDGVTILDPESITVKDVIANLTGNTYDQYSVADIDVNVIVTDAATIAELDGITTDGTITPMIVEGDYADLVHVDNAAWFTSNPDIVVTDVLTVAELAGVDALTTGELTYDLADTLAELAGAADGVVSGATSYALTDGAGALVITTLEEAQIIDGASNVGDYTYTIALSLAELVAADPLPATYTISDDAGDISVLTVEEALILDGADNAGDYTYTISDTAANVLADINGDDLVDGLAVAVTLTDTTIAAADLNAINTGISTDPVTIQATTLTGSTADVKTVFTNGALGEIDGAGDIAITITDAADTVINATDLMYIASLDGSDEGTTGVVTIQNAIVISGDAADLAEFIPGANANISYVAPIGLTFTDTVATVAELNAADLLTTGVITAEIAFTDIATALTLTDTNENNVFSIALGDNPTAQQLDALNGIYTTITGSLDVTLSATGEDISALDLSNADSIILTNDQAYTMTAAQALLVTVGTNANITISGAISVADANTVDTLTTGVVTATITETDATTLLTLADANTNNVYSATLDDASVDATDLIDLNDALILTVDAAVVTVTEDAANIGADGADVVTAVGLTDNAAVTITGAISVASIEAITGATDGVVTATVTGTDLGDASGLTAETAADILSITGLNGLTVSATDAIDTFVVDAADTGITLSNLTTGDVLDLSADLDTTNLEVAAEAANTDVDAAGEWHYDSGTGALTYWDLAGTAQVLTIDTGLTLTTDGSSDAITIG